MSYLTKDYEGFRDELVNLIPKKLPEWTDTTSSDAGIVILESLSYICDILSYYQDRIYENIYLPTATDKQSVIDICKLLNYRLKEATPSSVDLLFEITPDLVNATTIPRGFQVSTEGEDDDMLIFETEADLTIPAGNTGKETINGVYTYKVKATQGITVYNQIVGSSDNTRNQRFRLSFPDVVGSSMQLYVNEGAGFTAWTDVTEALLQMTDDGKHFWREVDSDGYTWIIFGNGLDGKIPASGTDNIQATYRVGGGAITNVGAGTIKKILAPISRLKSVTNPESASGGSDEETIDEARISAPLSLRVAERAVTKTDFKALAYKVPGVLKAYAENDLANNYLVKIYIIARDGFDPETLVNSAYSYVDDRKIVTTQVEVSEGEKIYTDISLTATLGDNYSKASTSTLIENTITNTLRLEDREFGEGLTIFNVYPALGQIEGINNLTISKFTIIPIVKTHTVTGNATWSSVTVNSANNLKGTWRVKMTSATAFTVHFDSTGNFTGSETSKGTGTLGTLFTSNGNEVSFTITAGDVPMQTDDYWTFDTQAYLGDISILNNQILVLGNCNIVVNGGVA